MSVGLRYDMPWRLAWLAPIATLVAFGLLAVAHFAGLVAQPGWPFLLIWIAGMVFCVATRCGRCGKNAFIDAGARTEGWPLIFSPINRVLPERICSRCDNELDQ